MRASIRPGTRHVDLDPDTSGVGVDRFEHSIALMIEGASDVKEAIERVGAALGIGGVRYDPVHRVNFTILPSSDQALRQGRYVQQARALVDLLESGRSSTGSAGREALRRARRELELLVSTEDTMSGGGLMLNLFRLAKSLGSGYRRALTVGIRAATSDLCLVDEPELHLHPSLIARLMTLLCDEDSTGQVVITTHSPIVIDEAARRGAAVFTLDTSNAENALRPIDTAEVQQLLSDLGWRPIHLVQANALIWVEGPSDEIYVSRWIDLWTGGALKNGADFVCVHYGGNAKGLLDREGGDISHINPHTIFICDRDSKPRLAKAKVEMIEQANSSGGYGFATDGREIENYLPRRVLEQLKPIPDGLDLRHDNLPRALKFNDEKVSFARLATRLLARSDIEADPDLAIRVNTICRRIQAWRQL